MKEFLSQRGVPYLEKYVDTDRAAAIEMIRRSGQQGVPVTVIGDDVVVGFDRPRLERILAKRAQGSQAGKENQGARKRSLGAMVKDASDLALHGGMPVQGAYVGDVRSGSAAESAGLRAGDVIVAVEERPIGTVDDLVRAIQRAASDTVSMTVARGATRRDVIIRF